MSEYQLDLRGLVCPLPLIRVQQQAIHASPGDILKVIATDPNVETDFHAWCRIHGHRLLEMKETDGTFYLTLQLKT